MMSLKPGSQVAESYSGMNKGTRTQSRSQSISGLGQLAHFEDQLGAKVGKGDSSDTADDKSQTAVVNGDDHSLCSPPRTENEVPNVAGLLTNCSSFKAITMF